MIAPNFEAALTAACVRIEVAITAVAQRLIDTLGAANGKFASAAHRQAQTNAQFDLRRKLPTFTVVLSDSLRELVLSAAQPPKPRARSLALTDYETLSLVAEEEVDERVVSDKLGAQIAQACEAELRELGGYVASLLQHPQPDPQRNPLRPEIPARALRRAIHATSDDKDTRLTLETEFARLMPAAMQPCYASITVDLQARGIRPTNLVVRTVQGPGNDLPREAHRESSGYQTSGFNSTGFQLSARDIAQAEQVLNTLFGVALPPGSASAEGQISAAGLLAGTGGSPRGRPDLSDPASRSFSRSGAMASTHSGATASARSSHPGETRSAANVPRDAQMLEVLRRLSSVNLDAVSALAGLSQAGPSHSPSHPHSLGSPLGPSSLSSSSGALGASSVPQSLSTSGQITPMAGLMAVNVIRQHRDELIRASTGTLDHMVIDVVGALFDQVLSDKKVPPAMARQISRLQLPVLRAALKDVGFFSSRRHPVRRFINRIASLAAAYEDLESGPGKEFIDRVQALVQEIVEGDFDQMDVYDAKLHEIEALIQAQSARDVGPQAPVAALIDSKATQLRIQQRYMRELTARLQTVSMPDFVRDFIAQVWSQVQVKAAEPGGSPEFEVRARRAARQLAMSLQPKGEQQLRKAFLMQLPQLMKDLNEGLALIRWPEEAKREFFAKLLPLHSEALKTTPLTDFEQRQLKHQLDQVDQVGIPTLSDLQATAYSEPMALPTQEAALNFTAEEAQQIGLVEEASVDWDGQIDIDLADQPAASGASVASAAGGVVAADGVLTSPAAEDAAAGDEVDIVLDALGPEAAMPTRGPQLVRHLQTGIAYRMHLEGRWQRVRLNWISPGRGFFVFTHGKAHEKTISMTARMITRLCDTERFRAYEQAELLERATARARKQLAKLSGTGETSKPGSLASQI